jgi:hypothetical protein
MNLIKQVPTRPPLTGMPQDSAWWFQSVKGKERVGWLPESPIRQSPAKEVTP